MFHRKPCLTFDRTDPAEATVETVDLLSLVSIDSHPDVQPLAEAFRSLARQIDTTKEAIREQERARSVAIGKHRAAFDFAEQDAHGAGDRVAPSLAALDAEERLRMLSATLKDLVSQQPQLETQLSMAMRTVREQVQTAIEQAALEHFRTLLAGLPVLIDAYDKLAQLRLRGLELLRTNTALPPLAIHDWKRLQGQLTQMIARCEARKAASRQSAAD